LKDRRVRRVSPGCSRQDRGGFFCPILLCGRQKSWNDFRKKVLIKLCPTSGDKRLPGGGVADISSFQ